MMITGLMSNLLRRPSMAVSILFLAACGNLNLGGSQATSWYTLTDLRANTPLAKAASVRSETLLIGNVDANPFYDSTQLAYSRTNIARAYYQFAAWTDRPTKRIASIVERRLADRGAFRTVATSTAGIRGDLTLNLTLDELYHDAQATPQKARIRMQAELIDQRTRRLVARREFTAAHAVSEPDSASAVKAMNEALTELLDQLMAWTESSSIDKPPG